MLGGVLTWVHKVEIKYVHMKSLKRKHKLSLGVFIKLKVVNILQKKIP